MAGDRESGDSDSAILPSQTFPDSHRFDVEMEKICGRSQSVNPTGKGRIEKVRDRTPPHPPPPSQLENPRGKTRPELALTFNCIKLRNGRAHILVKSTYSGFKKLYKKKRGCADSVKYLHDC